MNYYTSNIVRRIVKIMIMSENRLRDLKLKFSFLQCNNDNTGKMNVNAITGNQSNSNIAPTNGK